MIPIEDYYVTIRNISSENRRELRFKADDFGHAEEQAVPYLEPDDQIIQIVVDYDWMIGK